nr:hypothetical protein 1 [Virus sp.]
MFVQFLTLLGDSVIYMQIAALISLVILFQIAFNPLNKCGIALSVFLVFSLILKRMIEKMIDVFLELKWHATYSFEAILETMNVYGNRALTSVSGDANLEIIMALVIMITLIIIYAHALYKKRENSRVVYVVPQYSEERDTTYSAEKMMANSTFETVRLLPSFQAAVMGSIDGHQYYMIGQCFWVDEGLVTAAHVVEDYPFLSIFRDENTKVNIPADRFEIGAGDYAVCRQPTDIVQKLGLSKAKLSRLAIQKDSGISVNVVALNRRSIGFLSEHPQFGYIEYTGSTIKGFSGAPYYFGKTVFGMHIGSQNNNLGYDAAYLRSELKPSRVVKKDLALSTEDSATWLEEQIDRYEDFIWIRSPYDPDEYKVKVGGMYHIVDSEVLDTLLSKRKGSKRTSKIDNLDTEAVSRETYLDLHKEKDPQVAMVKGLLKEFGKTSICSSVPVNVEVPTTSGSVEAPINKESVPAEELPLAPRDAMTFNDSGNLIRAPTNVMPPVVAGAPGMVYPQVGVQSHVQPTLGPMAYVYHPPLVNYNMESLTSMPVPQSAVSASTARNRRARLRRQRMRKEHALYAQRYGPLDHGAQTSHQPPITTNGLIPNSTRP